MLGIFHRKEEGIETTGSVNHKTTCDDKTNGDGKCNQPLDVFSGRRDCHFSPPNRIWFCRHHDLQNAPVKESVWPNFVRPLYMKITLFRWSNSAILTKAITPFMDTLGESRLDLLRSINGVLIAEMIYAPLLRYLDPWGSFRKHFLAPRSPTQELMNLNFTGTVSSSGGSICAPFGLFNFHASRSFLFCMTLLSLRFTISERDTQTSRSCSLLSSFIRL